MLQPPGAKRVSCGAAVVDAHLGTPGVVTREQRMSGPVMRSLMQMLDLELQGGSAEQTSGQRFHDPVSWSKRLGWPWCLNGW